MMRVLRGAKAAYANLPPWARSGAASAYGVFLRYWRYGPDAERRVAEALARDGWTAEQWRAWQDPRLAELLHHAATRVPYYREQWRRRRAAGDDAPWDVLANWAILEKAALRDDSDAFVADGVDRRRLFAFHTSGTSGTPITALRSRETSHAWYALFEARNRRWYGVDRHARWAILGAQPIIPYAQDRPPFWVWNAGLRQLYLSAYHVAPQHVAGYLEAMRRHRVEYLLGYPSSIHALALMARDAGIAAAPLRVVISNAEKLHPHQRTLIAETFGGPVRDTYGMVEIVAGASECEHGVMHLWPDAGVVEVVGDEDGRPVAPGVVGQFVCTGLLNRDMPLVRYRLGDRGAVAPLARGGCACGRHLPVLERLDGRSTDNVVGRNGRRVFALAHIFDGLPIHERQLVQHEIDRFEVAIVPDGPFGPEEERVIAERMRELLGDVRVAVRLVESIPRGPNGKIVTTVSHVDPNALAPAGAPAGPNGARP
jgi:phenylacetate-CoA ligase